MASITLARNQRAALSGIRKVLLSPPAVTTPTWSHFPSASSVSHTRSTSAMFSVCLIILPLPPVGPSMGILVIVPPWNCAVVRAVPSVHAPRSPPSKTIRYGVSLRCTATRTASSSRKYSAHRMGVGSAHVSRCIRHARNVAKPSAMLSGSYKPLTLAPSFAVLTSPVWALRRPPSTHLPTLVGGPYEESPHRSGGHPSTQPDCTHVDEKIG